MRSKNLVQLRILARQVGLALFLNEILARPLPLRRALAIAAVQLLHHLNPLCHPPKRRKPSGIQSRVRTKIDVDLHRPRIRPRRCKADRPPHIRCLHRIVLDLGLISPRLRHRWIRIDPPLHDEARQHPEEPAPVIEAALHQAVESVRAQRRPRPDHLHDEITLSGHKAGLPHLRRLPRHKRRLLQSRQPWRTPGQCRRPQDQASSRMHNVFYPTRPMPRHPCRRFN